MAKPQEYSITRTRATFKPRVSPDSIPFFEDASGNVLLGLSGDETTQITGSGSTIVRHLPYANLNEGDEGSGARAVAVTSVEDLPEGVSIDYRIDGGFNANCVIVTWHTDAEHPLEWVCLKTFTGMQVKYALPNKRKRIIFALADEDAFAYCNKEPCVECGFRCKSGFEMYALIRGIGVVGMPLERISTLGVIGAGAKI